MTTKLWDFDQKPLIFQPKPLKCWQNSWILSKLWYFDQNLTDFDQYNFWDFDKKHWDFHQNLWNFDETLENSSKNFEILTKTFEILAKIFEILTKTFEIWPKSLCLAKTLEILTKNPLRFWPNSFESLTKNHEDFDQNL